MATNTNKSCDNCGTIVYGTDRGTFVRKSNIFINGQVGKNHVDPESGWRETKYLTRTAQEQLAFCDYECMDEWARTQEELWDNRKKAKLREEAEYGITGQERPHTGFNQRPAWSSGPSQDRQQRKTYQPPAPAPSRFGEQPKHIGYGGEISER